MRAIRPIYDGLDDLDELEAIDNVAMMACLFTHINVGIDAMKGLDQEKRETLKHLTDLEILPQGVISSERGINDDMYVPLPEDEIESYAGTEFDELIVMFEIVRWLEECGYEWDSVVTARYQYIARAVGIFTDRGNYTVGAYERDDYVLNVERRAFRELNLLLKHHWATILLDWYPVLINGIDNKELIEFGNLMIVLDETR